MAGAFDKRSVLAAVVVLLCAPAGAHAVTKVGTETSDSQLDFYDFADQPSILTAKRTVAPGADNDTVVFDDGPANNMMEAGADPRCEGQPQLPRSAPSPARASTPPAS